MKKISIINTLKKTFKTKKAVNKKKSSKAIVKSKKAKIINKGKKKKNN